MNRLWSWGGTISNRVSRRIESGIVRAKLAIATRITSNPSRMTVVANGGVTLTTPLVSLFRRT